MTMPERIQSPSQREPEYWVKSPGVAESFGPVGAARLAMFIQAGIVRNDSLISDGDADFLPVGEVKLKVLAAPEPRVNANPKVLRRDPVRPEPSADHAGENRFSGGYEALDVMRFNRMLEKEPDLKLPSRWKDPRMQDMLRFAVYGSIVTGVFAYAMYTLYRHGAMDKAGIASAAWCMGMGLIWLIVFILFPTRPGF